MGFFDRFRNRTTLAAKPTNTPLGWLHDGDKLFCRGVPGVSHDVITIQGHGPWCHVAMFYRDAGGHPMVVEMVETVGGRTLPFADWLADRATRNADESIDAYRPDAYGVRHYNRLGAVAWMLANIPGKPYGWATIKRYAKQASWLTCWWNLACTDEDAPLPDNYVCSTSCAAADKVGGGVHPVSALWVGDTSPIALARGKLHDYLVTFKTKA